VTMLPKTEFQDSTLDEQAVPSNGERNSFCVQHFVQFAREDNHCAVVRIWPFWVEGANSGLFPPVFPRVDSPMKGLASMKALP